MLEDSERDIIAPALRIGDEIINSDLSKIETRNSFLVCGFVSKSNDRCPFEVSFGRGPETGRFNVFVGLGAEFYNYESFNDRESRAAIKRDLDLFLRSVVRCERVIGRKGIAVERYTASKLLIDNSPVHFTFRKYYTWPFSEKVTEVINYRPWVE